MGRLKAIILGLSVAAAFAGGFTVATWRAGAQATDAIAQREAAYQRLVREMNEAIAADNARTQARETDLANQLADAHQQTEDLRREIAERPVVRQVVRTPVAGECAPVATVDWGVFAELYNRAAAGSPAPGAADARDATLSRDVVRPAF